MKLSSERLTYLLNGFRSGTASESEKQELTDWLATDPEDAATYGYVEELLVRFTESKEDNNTDWDQVFERILLERDRMEEQEPAQGRRITPYWWRWAAACLILLAGMGAWWLLDRNTGDTTKPETAIVASNLIPGHEGAILELSDGRQVLIDSLKDGLVANQQGTSITLKNKQLSYNPAHAGAEVTFNTMRTPNGRFFQLTLSDGTKVWLNAASSITYPTVFNGDERKVSISGEVYFEVAKQMDKSGRKRKSFIVNILSPSGKEKDLDVMVLGTHFNINAYDDEPSIRTTLFEGAVKLQKGNEQYLLQPGQQAQLKNGEMKIENNIDTDEVLAWKNGYFYFEHTDLQTVMRQIARWYDVTIEYQGAIPDMKFGGQIPRAVNAGQVLKILEGAELKFIVDGKKIIVTP